MTTEEPSVSTAGPDQDPLDAESPSQGWKEPDGLELELGSEGDRLSLGRVKVRLGAPLLTHAAHRSSTHRTWVEPLHVMK